MSLFDRFAVKSGALGRDSAAKSELATAARLNKEAAVLSLQEGEEAWAKQGCGVADDCCLI